MSNSWYNQGYDAATAQDTESSAMGDGDVKLYMPSRFWMKPQSSTEIVFVSSEPAVVYEHQLKIGDSFKNWFTCLKGLEDTCPICDKENQRALASHLTIVDLTKWIDKKGKIHQFELKSIVGKALTAKLWKRKNATRIEAGSAEGMKMGLYRVARDTDKQANCGSDFEYIRQIDPVKMFEQASYGGLKLPQLYDKAESSPELMKALQKIFLLELDEAGKIKRQIFPFNYMEVLKPQSGDIVKKKIAKAVFETNDRSAPEEEVPF